MNGLIWNSAAEVECCCVVFLVYYKQIADKTKVDLDEHRAKDVSTDYLSLVHTGK